jgi:hypothetical protein
MASKHCPGCHGHPYDEQYNCGNVDCGEEDEDEERASCEGFICPINCTGSNEYREAVLLLIDSVEQMRDGDMSVEMTDRCLKHLETVKTLLKRK